MLIDTEKPFLEDLSLENKEMFYRLKFRALNSQSRANNGEEIIRLKKELEDMKII